MTRRSAAEGGARSAPRTQHCGVPHVDWRERPVSVIACRTMVVAAQSQGLPGCFATQEVFSRCLIALLTNKLEFNRSRPIRAWVELSRLQPHLFAGMAPSQRR